MMKPVSKWLAVVAALAAATTFSGVAQASLIGQTLTHGCPQCGPPYSQTFVVTQGAGPELSPFSQWSLDVEADTVRIDWLISGFLISPLDFTLSGITGGITSVTVDAASSFLPTALTFTSSAIDMNFDGHGSVNRGEFLLLHVNQVAVPEPASLALLGLGIVAFGFARRRKLPTV